MLSPAFLVFSFSLLPLFVRASPASAHREIRSPSRHDKAGPRVAVKQVRGNLVATEVLTVADIATLTTTVVYTPTPSTIPTPVTLPVAAPTPTEVLFLPPSGLNPDQGTQSTPPKVPLVMAYYPDWTGKEFPPENVDFTRFDWIDFAFGVPDQSFNVTWDDPKGAPDLLRRLVQAAHANGKKVKLSVGGWSGSTYFSPAVATDQSRRIFANNILNTYNAFGLDGIDIDWEYPGQQGDGMNQVSPTDTPNFLAFLRLLRLVLPKGAKITAATQTSPFADANGNPIGNASQFGKVLDWILLMNYDVWGSSTMPGPNAPLSDGCGNSTQPGSNAVSAYGAWTNAGFPANKLVLGVPSYGYVSKSKATGLRQRSSHHQLARRAVHVANDDGSMTDGQVQVRSLISQGALIRTGGPQQFGGAHGFTRYWDGCSSTPFLRSSGASQVISYDDPESLGMKASFVKKVGMLGVNMFDVHGDTDQWDLTDSLRRGLGLIQ